MQKAPPQKHFSLIIEAKLRYVNSTNWSYFALRKFLPVSLHIFRKHFNHIDLKKHIEPFFAFSTQKYKVVGYIYVG